MVTSTSNTKSESLKLVFGPQDPNLDDTFLQTLRTTLLETPELQWVVDTLTQLPREWQKIADAHPELAAFQGQRYLDLLNKWVRRGVLPSNLFPLPNILVTPLVVTTQLAQYTKFVKQINPGFSSNDSLQGTLKLDTETVGLCTGLISSAAVASSANLAELQKHGAAAIRMATAIGALVDAGDSDHEDGDRWQSLAVGWTAHALESKLDSIVDSFPEVLYPVQNRLR